MKFLWSALLALTALPVAAQSLEDLNIQIHGYVTQGMIASTKNNWNTTNSSDGSAAWNEAVVNLTSQPTPNLRVGAQVRYNLLGNYGNALSLDWASGDYKVNEKFGIRVGKVKTPLGLLNETQDIDPAFLWSLLPQSVYPIASRNAILAHLGAVGYGSLRLGAKAGKLEYRVWGGQRVLGSDDGYFQVLRDKSMTVPNGMQGSTYGGTVRWQTPIKGLMVGASQSETQLSGNVQAQLPVGTGGSYVSVTGNLNIPRFSMPYYYARIEREKWMLAGEYSRRPFNGKLIFPITGLAAIAEGGDERSYYAMGSYRVSSKLTSGLYYSSSLNRVYSVGPSRFQKDWALSARYDFSSYLYAKFEQHLIDGTELGYSSTNNTSLQPNARMTLLKVGMNF